MVTLPKKKKEREEELVVIDDAGDFFYDDDEWEGCCEDPIELYEEDLLRENGDEAKR